MQPREDNDLMDVSFGKALALTLMAITIGMLEKAVYEIQDFIKKHIPH